MVVFCTRCPRYNYKNLFMVLCILLSLLCDKASAAPYVVMGNMVTRLNTERDAEGLHVETTEIFQSAIVCGAGKVFFIEQGGSMNKEMTPIINDGHAKRFSGRSMYEWMPKQCDETESRLC